MAKINLMDSSFLFIWTLRVCSVLSDDWSLLRPVNGLFRLILHHCVLGLMSWGTLFHIYLITLHHFRVLRSPTCVHIPGRIRVDLSRRLSFRVLNWCLAWLLINLILVAEHVSVRVHIRKLLSSREVVGLTILIVLPDIRELSMLVGRNGRLSLRSSNGLSLARRCRLHLVGSLTFWLIWNRCVALLCDDLGQR